jgi:hypothetical protein
MAGFEHLIKSYDVRDLLDDIASSDPPAYLRRCFAEGCAAPHLSWPRAQQVIVCAMVLDAVVHDRDYEFFEHELISDWRVHYTLALRKLQDLAQQALLRILEREKPEDSAALGELEALTRRVMGGD